MTEQDREILTWYFYGFHDELNRKSRVIDCTPIQNKAYLIGQRHAFIGDDMPQLDYISDAETLQIIKDEYEKEKEKIEKEKMPQVIN